MPNPMNKLFHCLVLLLATCSTVASAQRCGATCASAESLLDLSEQVLVAIVPELERVVKPVQGPRNSRGKWVLPDMRFGTQPYIATYFIRAGRVSRIEYLSTAPSLECSKRIPFDLALAQLSTTYGKSQIFGLFDGDGKSTQSAAFSTQTVDVSLHFSLTPGDCSTRVIFKPREQKDASEL